MRDPAEPFEPVGLEAVLIPDELHRRPVRPPDHAAEAGALAELVRTLAEAPHALLQRLAELILELCRAGSAGVSLLDADGGVFRWPAVAGVWAAHAGASLPRNASPCGVVIDRNAPLLFRTPGRHFPAIATLAPPIIESLVVPFQAGGAPVGTVWVNAHAPDRQFDAEDLRLLTVLSAVAAAHQRAAAALDRERDASRLIHDVSSRMIRTTGNREVYELILDAAVAVMRSDFASIQMFHPDRGPGGELELLGARGFSPEATAVWACVRPSCDTVCGAALRDVRRVVVEDVTTCDFLAGSPHLGVFRGTGIRAVQSTPLVSRDGTVVGMISTHWREPHVPDEGELRSLDVLARQAADLIERARAGEALRASAERLELALAAARTGIWTLDVATGTQTRDADLNGLLGLEPVETVQPFEEFLAHIHPDDRETVRAAFVASIRERKPLNTEFRVVRPDGAVRWLRDQGDVFHTSGAPLMAGACVDVTERREAEEALRRSEERVRLILSSATDFGIFTLDPNRVVTDWNLGAEATFGYAANEIVGRSGDVLFTPEDRAAGAPEAEAATARRDGRAEDERWHLRKNGSRFFASGVMTPLQDPRMGFVKVARDRTERKRMEDELRDARDRLEARVAERTAELAAALESLEGEIARRASLTRRLATAQEDERRRVARDLHDSVGQLLAGLSLAFKAVTSAGALPAASAARLAEAQRVADALGKEVHALAVRLRPTSLDDIGLEAALGQLVAEWSERTGVRADFHAAGLGPGRLSPEIETTLYRIVQEALTNVAKHARATRLSVVVARPDGYATATIEDDGAGFDPDTVPKGRLGLLGIRERIALVGGAMEVESSPGSGTTVGVRVPVSVEESGS